MSFRHLGIFVFSHAGAMLALRLRRALAVSLEEGGEVSLLGPRRLLARHAEITGFRAYVSLQAALAPFWQPGGALIFVGAAGIAVRAIAPLVRHKSSDVPVLALDAMGRYCISLLSGHWGGGNALTEAVARAVGATPVVTTASESLGGKLSLDLLIRDAGAKILDWDGLAVAQGHILEGRGIPLWDPMHVLRRHELLLPARRGDLRTDEHAPALAVHWKRLARVRGLVRVAAPVLHVGIGFRKNVPWADLRAGLNEAMTGLEMQAISSLATVAAKAGDEAIVCLAERLGVAIEAYSPEELARVATPNPSAHAGTRFGMAPFSVCEAAALLSAAGSGRPCLLRPKIKIREAMTFAIAIAVRGSHA